MLCRFSWENPGTQGKLHILTEVTFCLHPLLINFGAVGVRWLSLRLHLLGWCVRLLRQRHLPGCPAAARPAESIPSVRFPEGLSSACMTPGSWPYENLHSHPTMQSNVVCLSLNLSPCCPDFQTAAFTR